ncbi:MAG: S9 family peptidase [Longimicrobiales bacterium]
MIHALTGLVTAVVSTALALLVAFAANLSIPKPPSITAEGIPKVSLRPMLRNLDLLARGMQSKAIATWMPNGNGVLVRAKHWVVDSRLHWLAEPGGELKLLEHIPRNVGTIASRLGRDYVVFSWDEDGAEQYKLYRWDLDESKPVPLTDGHDRAGFGAFEPHGTRFAFVSSARNGVDVDVYVGDPMKPGSEKMVFEGSGTWIVFDWSPVGDLLVLGKMSSNVESELHTLDLRSGRTELISKGSDGPTSHRAVRFTQDGTGLYFVSDEDSEFKHLRRYDLSTGVEAVLTDEISWDVEGAAESDDGSFLLLSVNEDGVGRHYVYDVADDETRPLDLFPTGLTTVSLHRGVPDLIVNHADGSGVARGYTYDLESQRLTQWAGAKRTESNALFGNRIRATELIRYPTFDEVDGHPRQISAFVYPGVGDGPRPVLINIHGGPEAQARLTNGHVQAQRAGFTVIAPNVRGSTGYGKSFTKLDDGVLREDAVKDIGALLDWIATRPDMDGTRVGVQGGSYGGYMTLASLVHFGSRIKCGVDVVGVSNFVTFLENTAPYRQDLRRAEYGDERDPEMRAFLESISPLTHAERIVSPLMVVQGANDPRVPVTESRQMVAKVRGNKQPVGYIEAADEGHGFRKPWNALYASTAQLEMMERCLAN